ncbi:hypothetical protein SAMN06265364_13238 [Prevotella jejuni]|uniref:Uncharacterized protein n=1 Tax=Prevotella jejuni TaxID=1177574 RepID=A0AA94IW00_9BACT|nr:hypothetical protein SAMN06265364_13238 [Prevotella jejuni]
MKIILREGCFMGPYVRLHFLILYLFPSKEWLLFAYAFVFLSFVWSRSFLVGRYHSLQSVYLFSTNEPDG